MDLMVKHAMRDTRVQLVVSLFVFLIVAGLGWWLYSSYRTRINEQAQFAFALQIDNLERLRRDASTDATAWEALEAEFFQAFQQHSSSDLAPFYMACQAEAALHLKKEAEAMSLLEKAIQLMGTSHPLYYLYAIKLQVIRLSSQDAPVRQEGLRELRALALDINNPHRGYAWYQIWHNAWVQGDEAVAQEALAKLTAYQNQGAQWGQLAQAKMEFAA